MEKKNNNIDRINSKEEEMDWDSFFNDEEDAQKWEKDKADKRKRKKMIMKIVSSLLVFALLISGFQVWFQIFNIPAIRFVEVSNRLSKNPDVKEYKKSVVTIEWNGVKGTGFIIAANGLIITNEHVVKNTNRVNVHTKTDGSFVGEVIAKHPEQDLAIVSIKASKLPILPLSQEKDIKDWQGEKIIFIGNPLAFTQIANEGTVIGSVRLKDWDIPVMMIEAPIYKGNSGSPVLNQNGEVIGVIFATLQNPSIQTKEIIGVAIPSYHIEEIIREINQ